MSTIQEHVRQLSAAERAELQAAMRPQPIGPQRPRVEMETWAPLLIAVLTLAVIALAGGNRGGLAIASIAVALVGGYRWLTTTVKKDSHPDLWERRDAYMAERRRALALVLEDGRVAVKRVRAVAVVELEPIEDEGPGYLFDLGDGRVLFLKGEDYHPLDDEGPSWPNTDFEIARAVLDGTFIGLYCHGRALAPLRVIRGEECDPERAWAEREEVLDMSLDEAVRTVLRTR